MPDPYSGITLYADLSQATIMAWKNLTQFTEILHNHKMMFHWGFPAKFLIERNNKSHTITLLER